MAGGDIEYMITFVIVKTSLQKLKIPVNLFPQAKHAYHLVDHADTSSRNSINTLGQFVLEAV